MRLQKRRLIPYYQTKLGKLYKGNCLEVLPRISKATIAITSPPYNKPRHIQLNKDGPKYTEKDKYISKEDLKQDEYDALIQNSIHLLLQKTNYTFYNYQYLVGNRQAFYNIFANHSIHLKEILIWDKLYAQPVYLDNIMRRQFEFIFIFSTNGDAAHAQFPNSNIGKDTFNIVKCRSHASGKLKIPNDKKYKNFATFPLQLVEWLLDKFAKPGDVILDPFMGAGTVAVICERKGFKWIGIEKEKNYCDLIVQNVINEQKQPKLL